MAENEEQEAGGAAGETIGALGNRLKALFEEKRWRELGEELALPTVWFLHAPKTMAEALELAAEVLGGASEVELSLVRVLRSESGAGGAARGSYTCCLAWLEPAGWKQQEVQFDLHLGFEQDGGGRWKLAYLGVTPAAPEMAPPPAGGEERPGILPGLAGADAAPGGEPVMVYVPVFLPPETVQALLRGARREG
jgi:hypothetical protein